LIVVGDPFIRANLREVVLQGARIQLKWQTEAVDSGCQRIRITASGRTGVGAQCWTG
jgi:hypothetical protein